MQRPITANYTKWKSQIYANIGIRKLEFVTKTQFLYATLLIKLWDHIASLVLILCTSMRVANLSGDM